MPFRHMVLAATSALSIASIPAMTYAAEKTPTKATAAKAKPSAGPFANTSTLPFQAPDFTKIKDADYLPAIEAGIAAQQAEITAIANNPDAPTFDNTLAAMERSGQVLTRASAAFFAVVGANTNDALDAVETAVSPKLAAHADEIYLNAKLFARVKALYDARATLSLTGEQARLLETTYERFVNAGAQLNDADKVKLKGLNEQLSTLGTEFSQKLTQATKDGALVVNTREELAGLSDAEIDAAAKEAKDRGQTGKYVLALVNTTQQPLLASLTNRETRRKLYEASVTRTSHGDANDTRKIIARLAELRADKAALLGYPDFATSVMYDRMVKTPAEALDFMAKLVTPLASKQVVEAGELDTAITQGGGDFTVRPWDWDFYAEKVRKAKYDLDQNEVKPYFQVDRVLQDGVFHAANLMYGLTFEKRNDIPVYHPDVTVYTVRDRDGSDLALFYFDPYARPNKQGGAWMGNFVEQSRLMGTKPVIYNVLNIPKAGAGEPQLVSWDDVITMFHEFGHGLHGLFADQDYPSLSGTNTARDFVEFPSQFNENFATQPSILANYAKHYQTGATIPAALMDKITKSRNFNQGYALGEVVAAALLDMRWHALKAGQKVPDADAFEKQALDSLALRTDLVPPRYYSAFFRHIWDHGYAAGYYSYLWTEMIAHDAFSYLMDHGGGLTRAAGDNFRAKILSRGNSMDYAEMYRAYAGRDPQIEAMVEARGLDDGK
ncbi:peptidyl dipeptidase [Caenibius tardaugens NBRC 16725]|uniref:Dipeptidyl carboxypeptidase n=2 Tax=Caenibius TaxID=2827482 RepID=U2Y4Z5_9SPHN|nr:M3 family peptidase [Caenibius tardaugens NBRC 16725]GAD48196.1 peptidyl dipeptidase [Caenibius tardaugens NBRC 16725]